MTMPYNQSGVVAGCVAASASLLLGMNALNKNAATRWIQFFDLAAAPTTGVTVPAFEFMLAAGTGLVVDDWFTNADTNTARRGMRFANGIAWGFSTTQNLYTAATAADHELTLNVVTGLA